MTRFNKISSILIFVMVFTGMFIPLSNYLTADDNTGINRKKGDQEEGSYALLVRKVPHIHASLKTATQMRNAGNNYQDFEVVICGKTVKKLSNNKAIVSMLQKGDDLDIRFSVCGMSLNKFNVEPSSLPEDFKIVDNGLIRIFELQKKGYHTLEL